MLMDFISKPEIIQALKRLGQLAESYDEQIELVTIGGALMLLAYDARPTTKDIDVLITMPDNTSSPISQTSCQRTKLARRLVK